MSAPTGTRAWLLSSAILFSCPLVAETARAAATDQTGHATVQPTVFYNAYRSSARMTLPSGGRVPYATHVSYGLHPSHGLRRRTASDVGPAYHISCVPYARQASGIMVVGNAWQWWENASGLYARGDRPEPGSVLNFRSNGRMRLGHVAVVTRVVNPREVIVDQANWPSTASGRGGVSHDVTVVDVSEANNWSAVRVELGRGGEFGSVYPTYGFIYNRPDTGVVTASVERPAPQPAINRVPSDLRPVAERPWHTVEEVAEAPATTPQRIDLSVTSARVGQ